MVVEDSADSRIVISEFLKKYGAHLEMTVNGREAVGRILQAEKTDEPFDFVLMDIQLPVMDGYQATRLLRQRGFTKPIVAITSHNLQGDRDKQVHRGGLLGLYSQAIGPAVF